MSNLDKIFNIDKYNDTLNIFLFKEKHFSIMNSIWNDIFHSNKLNNIDTFPSIYISYKKINNNWIIFCESSFSKLGLCSNLNLLKELILEIKLIIKLYKNIKFLPIHINLTLFIDSKTFIHANTLLLNTEKKKCFIFEPMGRTIYFEYSFEKVYVELWNTISKKLDYTFCNFILPTCRFQLSNNNHCNLWSTWFEFIIIMYQYSDYYIGILEKRNTNKIKHNKKINFDKLMDYFKLKYKIKHKHFIFKFSNFLIMNY